MIDVNQLTQQLRLMPDQALQQIAMMYKDDPYILPMVISEDTARKKLRMAAQAQAAQPQGTVKDQAIMSMGREPQPPQQAPDEAGIAALQAPNMENMADGGIAGEPEMSEFDFAQRSEPVVRMAGGGVPRYQVGGTLSISPEERYRIEQKEMDEGKRFQFSPETLAYFAQRRSAAAERSAEDIRAQELARGKAAYQASGIAATPARPAEPAKPAAPAVAAGSGRGTSPGGPMPGEQITYPALRKEAPGKKLQAAPTGEGSAASAATSGAPRPDTVEGARAIAQQIFPTNVLETQLNVQRERERERYAELERERERTKPQGKLKAGLEALLKKEEEGEGKERDEAKAFALINAGLAIASGESPKALVNLAKGLNIGAQQYQAAVKDLKKAAQQRRFMQADIEDARYAEARGDWKDAAAAREKAADRETASERYQMSGLQALNLKQGEITSAIYRGERELTVSERIANIRAAAARDPNSKEAMAVARVMQAVNASPLLKELAKGVALGDPKAVARYKEEEERIYLQNAPELLLGSGGARAGAAGSNAAAALSAGDRVLQRSGQ